MLLAPMARAPRTGRVARGRNTPRASTHLQDADQLFKSAPGGARGYLFRRIAATKLLEPIAGASDKGRVARDKIAGSVRRYFEEAAASLPFGQPSQQHSNLTPREHEILGLL